MKLVFSVLLVVTMLSFSGISYAQEQNNEGDAPADGFQYVELDSITIPIVTNEGNLLQQLTLSVSIEVDDSQKKEVDKFKPRLTDAYIQDLYGALGAGYGFIQGNLVDIGKIKERLSSVTNKVLGPDLKVHAVLLSLVHQQPL